MFAPSVGIGGKQMVLELVFLVKKNLNMFSWRVMEIEKNKFVSRIVLKIKKQ
jgi:hypothetical protein